MKENIKDIIKEHRRKEEIFDKHNQEFHYNLGRAYDIPECCVDQFCKEMKEGIIPGAYREKKYRLPNFYIFDLDYIPCDKCIEKMLGDLGVDF